jgi:hypothetical protein
MTKEKFTKEFILDYLKEYYEKNKKIPLSKDKEHPFSYKTVGNKFGTWNDALILAKIPLIRNNPVQVKCKQCNTLFKKQVKEIKKSENHFCSRSCCAIYNNSIRTEETNNKIKLSLQKYNNIKNKDKIQESHKCILCENMIYGARKTCSKNCMTQANINNGKISGKKAGKASAASQQRRSKNEVICAELCIEYFGKDDIQCNEQIFKDKNGNFWDCDIYIKSLKIAILWDGYYYHHGPNVSKKQKARDQLKRKIILDNDCTYYTIIDKGKFNKEFVQEQFDLFIHKVHFKNVISEFKNKI